MTKTDFGSLRETQIGAIAADWEMGVIADFVSSLQAGVSVNAVETESGCSSNEIGVLKTSAVSQGKFFREQCKVVIPEDTARVATSVVRDRVIISRMNTPTLVGESGYVAQSYPNLFLPDRLWQTVPSKRPHSQRWLSYWLQHPRMRGLISAAATGTSNSMKNISKESVLSLPVPRTPLREQQKIVAILTVVDNKLDVVTRQIEATKTLKRGLIQTLYSRGMGTLGPDNRWVRHARFRKVNSGTYPASWQWMRMGVVAPIIRREAKVQAGGTYPELGLRSFGKGTFHKPALNSIEVGSKRLFVIKTGDLLLSNVFAWEGAIAVAKREDDGRYGSHRYITCEVDLARASPDFIARYLLTRPGLAAIGLASPGGAGRNKTLGLSALADIKVPVPPLAEQFGINDTLEAVQSKINLLEIKRERLKALKRGLMQKLLTGEWRVNLEGAEAVAA